MELFLERAVRACSCECPGKLGVTFAVEVGAVRAYPREYPLMSHEAAPWVGHPADTG